MTSLLKYGSLIAAVYYAPVVAEGDDDDLPDVGGAGGSDPMAGLEGLGDLMKGLGGKDGEGLDFEKMMKGLGGADGLNDLFKNLGGGEGGNGFADLLKNMNLGDLGGGLGGKPKKQNLREKFCKAKKVVPVPKIDQFTSGDGTDGKLVVNGCGPAGLKQDEPYGLHRCCNRHDLCYSVCDSGFDWCEREFKKCMRKICKDQDDEDDKKECKKKADEFASATSIGGATFYLEGQKQACEEECLPKDEAKEKFVAFLTGFYSQYNKENVDEVESTLQKYKGKEGQLWLGLLRKYGIEKNLIEFDEIHEEL